eukprot:4037516-Prymnesium_polylepis.2
MEEPPTAAEWVSRIVRGCDCRGGCGDGGSARCGDGGRDDGGRDDGCAAMRRAVGWQPSAINDAASAGVAPARADVVHVAALAAVYVTALAASHAAVLHTRTGAHSLRGVRRAVGLAELGRGATPPAVARVRGSERPRRAPPMLATVVLAADGAAQRWSSVRCCPPVGCSPSVGRSPVGARNEEAAAAAAAAAAAGMTVVGGSWEATRSHGGCWHGAFSFK